MLGFYGCTKIFENKYKKLTANWKIFLIHWFFKLFTYWKKFHLHIFHNELICIWGICHIIIIKNSAKGLYIIMGPRNKPPEVTVKLGGVHLARWLFIEHHIWYAIGIWKPARMVLMKNCTKYQSQKPHFYSALDLSSDPWIWTVRGYGAT